MIVRLAIRAACLDLEVQNHAGVVQLCAEWKMGKVLCTRSLRREERRLSRQGTKLKLRREGISLKQAARWRLVARLLGKEEDLAACLQEMMRKGKELTSARLLRWAESARLAGKEAENVLGTARRLWDMARQGERFACIYLDPPWGNAGKRPAAIARFATALACLPLRAVAEDWPHLHLWVSPAAAAAGPETDPRLGFSLQGDLNRPKPPEEFGDYWQEAHDTLLLGVRGRLPFGDNSLPSWIDPRLPSSHREARRIQALIARASPPPYLGLFGAVDAPGWTIVR